MEDDEGKNASSQAHATRALCREVAELAELEERSEKQHERLVEISQNALQDNYSLSALNGFVLLCVKRSSDQHKLLGRSPTNQPSPLRQQNEHD